MTPKEKANNLVEKFLKTDKKDNYSYVGFEVAKECALIAVGEIIEVIDKKDYIKFDYWYLVRYHLDNI
jgi:hypothetical protein